MKKNLLFIFVLLCTFSATYAVKPKKQIVNTKEVGLATINRNMAEAHINFLAGDNLKGREAGTSFGRIAGDYIISMLKQWDIAPLFETYEQPFSAYRRERQHNKDRFEVNLDSIAKLKEIPHQRINLRNIFGMIEGNNPNEYVIVGAHYDHVGMDTRLEGDQIYNGADDNASGVSAALQLARAFKLSGQKPERTIIFAFWDGEEEGLLGSKYFTLYWEGMNKVKSYMNFDMIGRNNKEDRPMHFVYFYTQAYPAFEQWLRSDIENYHLQLEPDYRAWDNPVGGSDNGSFAKKDVPIIWYHTDGHPDYHMPSDEPFRLNWNKLVEITKAAYLATWRLANENSY
ncbi:M28 family metallopeptidase [Phocaeicola oris]|uniref:M28 family metallopeptidase n=1 Tax=Phocaeicola oris TaxID=2896850 RepID=UPI00234F63D4|nr:M20/M25/M40 family metallo-hydrolase [Phocaeicola oris]MCE2616853.1 M20/M25/M40 family metallo-hydrolase [Phocaeicola oris]